HIGTSEVRPATLAHRASAPSRAARPLKDPAWRVKLARDRTKGMRVQRSEWLGIKSLGQVAGVVAVPVVAIGLYLGLVWAPPDAMMGNVQRVMYVHFPSWIATA